jgi:hypothetical protein
MSTSTDHDPEPSEPPPVRTVPLQIAALVALLLGTLGIPVGGKLFATPSPVAPIDCPSRAEFTAVAHQAEANRVDIEALKLREASLQPTIDQLKQDITEIKGDLRELVNALRNSRPARR